MRVYRMSETGNCPRVLAARQLGYEPVPDTEAQKRIMKESSRHEGWVIETLESEGYNITSKQEELVWEVPLFTLVGHIDGIAEKDGVRELLEIKALGRFTYDKYLREGLSAYPDYQAQVTCYAEVLLLPILFVVKCRDTGAITKTSLEKAPLNFTDIIDKLNLVELCVQDGELPPGTYNEKSQTCRWCKFKYLCLKEEPTETIRVEEVPSLLEAAALYKEGDRLTKEGDEKKELAKNTFLNYAKTNKIDKFRTGGVSISYLGTRQKQYLDEARLRELVSEDVLKQAYRMGKEWDDIRIRLLKED